LGGDDDARNCSGTAAPLDARFVYPVIYISTLLYISKMALSIKDPEADRLARAVAEATGETLTAAVVQSLRERLARVRRSRKPHLADELLKIGRRCASLPVQDAREAEAVLGYDEHGLPR
jgi:antitoxin VapB